MKYECDVFRILYLFEFFEFWTFSFLHLIFIDFRIPAIPAVSGRLWAARSDLRHSGPTSVAPATRE